MRLPKFFRGIAFVAAAVSLSLVLCFAIMAWSEPGATPPGGNVASPINTGGITQTKSGDLKIGTGLTITSTASAGGTAFALAANVAGNTGNKLTVGQDGNVIVGAQLTAPKICFGGNCRTQWAVRTCPTGQCVTGIKANGDVDCSGAASCTPKTCVAGTDCGTVDNNCGGTINCLSCTAPKVCNASGKCVDPACIPYVCAADDCESHANGNCGGTKDCGSCTSPRICNASGKCVCRSSCTVKAECCSNRCVFGHCED